MTKKTERFEMRLDDQFRALADDLAKARGVDSFSALVRLLLREEQDRASGKVSPAHLALAVSAIAKAVHASGGTPSSESPRKIWTLRS